MSDMVEQVAGAILTEIGRQADEDAHYFVVIHGVRYIKFDGYLDLTYVARTAIQAMREPPIGMIREADKVVAEPGAMRWWRAMIDEALKWTGGPQPDST